MSIELKRQRLLSALNKIALSLLTRSSVLEKNPRTQLDQTSADLSLFNQLEKRVRESFKQSVLENRTRRELLQRKRDIATARENKPSSKTLWNQSPLASVAKEALSKMFGAGGRRLSPPTASPVSSQSIPVRGLDTPDRITPFVPKVEIRRPPGTFATVLRADSSTQE